MDTHPYPTNSSSTACAGGTSRAEAASCAYDIIASHEAEIARLRADLADANGLLVFSAECRREERSGLMRRIEALEAKIESQDDELRKALGILDEGRPVSVCVWCLTAHERHQIQEHNRACAQNPVVAEVHALTLRLKNANHRRVATEAENAALRTQVRALEYARDEASNIHTQMRDELFRLRKQARCYHILWTHPYALECPDCGLRRDDAP